VFIQVPAAVAVLTKNPKSGNERYEAVEQKRRGAMWRVVWVALNHFTS